MLTKLISWLTDCWTPCDNPTGAQLVANVISCVLRAVIILAILYTVARLGDGALNAIQYTGR